MAVTNIITDAQGWVQNSLEKYALGESITWAGGFTIMPTEQGLVPVFCLNVIIPSLVLGETIQTLSHIPVSQLEASKMDEAVKEIVEALKSERTKQAGSIESSLVVPS